MPQRQHPAALTDKEVDQLLATITVYAPETVDSYALVKALMPRCLHLVQAMVRQQRLRITGRVVGMLGTLVCLILSLTVEPRFAFGYGFFLIVLAVFLGKPKLRDEENLAVVLALLARQINDEHTATVAPELLELLQAIGEPELKGDAFLALERVRLKAIALLPYLTRDEAQTLTEKQRYYLRQSWLSPEAFPNEQVAALLTLASAQDREAVPLAQALLAQTTNETVREAAQELLKAVEQ